MMNLSSKSASQQQKQIVLRNTLDRCSTHDYETTWRQIRKAGNTSLYAQMPEYIEWAKGSGPETLILVGKLGYGKSVILANMVDDLNLRADPEVSGLAYFFCRHDLPESLAARTVIGALIRQIISLFPQRLVETEAIGTDDYSRLINLMHRVVPPRHRMYIVLDGLDLCSSSERKKITEQLELMRTQFDIRTCLSRRLELEANLQSFVIEFPRAKTVRLPDNTPDIEAFITAQLEAAVLNESLRVGDPDIIDEIKDALSQGSEHIFLWAALQIQSLCAMQTDHDIREALVDLPRDLFEIYDKILQQAKAPGRSLQSNTFKLIIAARRPLTAHEMREALSVTPGDTAWDPSKVLNSVHPTLATCGCLITVDEEEQTIRTIHLSVNQFLLQESSKSPTISEWVHFTMDDAKEMISSIIVTYLGYGIFGNEVAVRLPTLDVGSAPSHIIKSMTNSNKVVQAIILKRVRSKRKPDFNVPKTLSNRVKRHVLPNMDDLYFQHYAKSHVLTHLAELPVMQFPISNNLLRLIKQGKVRNESPDHLIGQLWIMLQPPGDLDIAGYFGHVTPESAIDVLGASFCKLFDRAIELGRVGAVRYLLDTYRPAFSNWYLTMHGTGNPIHPVVKTFCCLKWLREPYRDELLETFIGPTPLSYAIAKSQDAVAQRLMNDNLIDVNERAGAKDLGLWGKPIGIAMEQKNVTVLKSLLLTTV
ncbi:hypothetical protein AA0113_g12775 [Alternaria arborescens]|uniref:Uncharacterized protein n=1 Tax=Alternaria arborescens TaxID=156630 RepID=A0A4Q4PW59_9PLEO|nr:hypothetical protein AA0113_g12775 [Alternaria arborescens]